MTDSNSEGLPAAGRWYKLGSHLIPYDPMKTPSQSLTRRHFLGTASVSLAAAAALTPAGSALAAEPAASAIIRPPVGKRILLSCKLGMIPKEIEGKKLSIVERLKLAAAAGFDGVDFDQAGEFTVEQARDAVRESGVFVHNAINHAHWSDRLTSADEAVRAKGRANIEHCIRCSHAAGGSGVLIVVGRGDDAPTETAEDRCREEIKKLLPLAASLGQMILIENVWNQMMYDHDGKPDQGAERFIRFVDSFRSPWVGMYYDIGNHWKYGQPAEWIRAFGHRCVKLDVKGFSRAKDKFVDITSEDDDLPWGQVQKALADIGFTGWATAEVGGGGLERLTVVRQQMEKAFGLV